MPKSLLSYEGDIKHQGALTKIIVLAIFAGIALRFEKVGTFLFMFGSCPFLPSVATDDSVSKPKHSNRHKEQNWTFFWNSIDAKKRLTRDN